MVNERGRGGTAQVMQFVVTRAEAPDAGLEIATATAGAFRHLGHCDGAAPKLCVASGMMPI
jgi:hypothetical protein